MKSLYYVRTCVSKYVGTYVRKYVRTYIRNVDELRGLGDCYSNASAIGLVRSFSYLLEKIVNFPVLASPFLSQEPRCLDLHDSTPFFVFMDVCITQTELRTYVRSFAPESLLNFGRDSCAFRARVPT